MPLAAFRRCGSDSDSRGISAKLNGMPPRLRSRPLAGFIEPCLPRPVDRPPIGGDWLHEIKHDGFRIMARRDAAGARLLRAVRAPRCQGRGTVTVSRAANSVTVEAAAAKGIQPR
jgi:hypothetical protein